MSEAEGQQISDQQNLLPHVLTPILIFLLGVSFPSFSLNSSARADGAQVPSVLECSALSTNPKIKKFTSEVSFFFANNSFRGERTTGRHPGKEVYSGSIDRNKVIKIVGRGAYYNTDDIWQSGFSGSLKDRNLTVLTGSLDPKRGGRRDCSITFLLPPDKLANILVPPTAPVAHTQSAQVEASRESPKGSSTVLVQEEQTRKKLADLAEDLVNKQKALQAAQEDLKKQQADAARDLADKHKVLQMQSTVSVADTQTAQEAPSESPKDSSAVLPQEEQTRKKLADLVEDLANKQKALQAGQEDLKKQQADVARDFAEKEKELQAATTNNLNEKQKLQAGQDKLVLTTKDINDRQKELEVGHKALKQEQASLKQEQAKTTENVNWVQKLLDGIILPTTEDPNSWVLRVAAVPVQQQQFCRIVDQFYDDLDKVYQTRNDIKKNTLFRDRQLSMAALLPHGEFSNWVVQVKEVTQAPDGSAAVMLQPPCRAMLGSDACQKNGSKIQATISPNSPLYRELGLVNAGDFIVISGKVLYAESSDDKPLPTYAIYQAGSHCSATEGSKQEDVFVTNISYLVQLR
jgi:hypothetical protein